MSDVSLLRIPESLRSVEDVLGTAQKLNLQNVIVLSEGENGEIVFLANNNLTVSSCNWMIDRLKVLLVSGVTSK